MRRLQIKGNSSTFLETTSFTASLLKFTHKKNTFLYRSFVNIKTSWILFSPGNTSVKVELAFTLLRWPRRLKKKSSEGTNKSKTRRIVVLLTD